MAVSARLLLISGSLREDSANTKLVREAARLFGPCESTLAELRLPLYDGDLEANEGAPESVRRLVAQVREADAVAISTPEYNGNLSGVLKNALDWISRDRPIGFDGKPTAIMSAAAGRAGGLRAQNSLRLCLTAFRPRLTMAPEVGIADCRNAFDEGGRLKEERAEKLLAGLMERLRAMI